MAAFNALISLNLSPSQLLYSGSSVSVYSGTYQNYQVVFKVLELPPGVDPPQLEGECQRMRAVQHENVVQLYNYYWAQSAQGTFLVLVLEACDKDLTKDMKQREENGYPYSEQELWDTMVTLIRAFAYMQRQGLAHRDIKPDNIFLSRGIVKIGDFGSSRNSQADQMTATLVGTPIYLSPVLRQGLLRRQHQVAHNVFKSDVYSLGLTLFALATLQTPVIFLMGEDADIEKTVWALSYSEGVKRLMLWMLEGEEAKRPDFVEMDEWITRTYYSQPELQPTAPQSFEIQTRIPGGAHEERKVGNETRQEWTNSEANLRAIPGETWESYRADCGQYALNAPLSPPEPYRPYQASQPPQQSPHEYPQDPLQRPLLPYYSNPCCLFCEKEAPRDPGSLVQLKCDPVYHVYCSVKCFITDLEKQRPPYKCVICQSPIEQNDLESYCVKMERDTFRARTWRTIIAAICCYS